MTFFLFIDWIIVVHVFGQMLGQSRLSRLMAICLGAVVMSYAVTPQ